MNIVVSDSKPAFATAVAQAVEVMNSEDGVQFAELCRLGAPMSVLNAWAYSVESPTARRTRKTLLYAIRYGSAAPDTGDLETWRAAHADVFAAFNIKRPAA